MAYLSFQAGLLFFILSVILFVIGVSYSCCLSKNLFLSLVAHPVALVIAMNQASLLSLGKLDLQIVLNSLPVFLLFLGAKTWIGIADMQTDKKTGKPNPAMILGEENAKRMAFLFLSSGLFFALVLSFSFSFFLFLAAILAVFLYGFLLKPQKGIHFIMSGVFLFLLVKIVFYLMR